MAKQVLLSPREALSESWALLMRRISERIGNNLTAIEPHVEIVNELLDKALQVGKAILDGDVPAIKGTVQNFSGSILELFEHFQTTITEIEAERDAAEAARAAVAMQLELSERQRQEALAQREREVELLRERATTLDSAMRAGDGSIFKSIQELAKQSTATLDVLIADGSRLQLQFERITRDVREVLPELEGGSLKLEHTITDLSVRAAPFLVQSPSGQDVGNLEELQRIMKDLDEVQRQYKELNELLATYRTDFAGEETIFNTWQETWREVRQIIDAAGVIFPRITAKDLYTLAGTASTIVRDKRQFCGSLLSQLQGRFTEARTELDRRAEAFAKSEHTIQTRISELIALRERLHIPWFEALVSDRQELVRLLLLSYDKPTERISTIQLAAILVAHTALPREGSEEIVLELMSNDFFTPRGSAGFKIFVLTERGKFWWRRWREEHRDLVGSLAVAKEQVRHENIAAAEEEKRIRDERTREQEERRKATEEGQQAKEREREAKKAERRNPQVILERLKQGEQELLTALSFRTGLPAPRDSAAWSKLLAAMQSVGLLSSRGDPGRLSRSLASLLQFDPCLFVADRSTGNLMLRFSDIGLETVRILPTLDTRYGDDLESMMDREIRIWAPAEMERRKRLAPFCEQSLGALPKELYSKND